MNKFILYAMCGLSICGYAACWSNDKPTQSAAATSGSSSSSSDAVSSSSAGGGNNSSSSTSSSSGIGGSHGDGGSMLMNGDPCYFNNYEGVFEDNHCLLCGKAHLNDVLAGYPLNPDSCYQFVCQSDPGNAYYAFPTKNVKEANTPCIYPPDIQPINNATCTEDGQCCYTDQNIGDICSPVPMYP